MSDGNFVHELRRRHMFRMATAYVATSWLLVQVATQVFPFFHVADLVVRWMVVALAGGFPMAMLFAWIHGWAPESIQPESAAEPTQSSARETGRRLDFWIIGALSLAVVFLLVDAFVTRGDDAAVATKSIAVLPLGNVSADDDELYFSDGISENLIAALSQVSGLKVISRNSSFRFRDSSDDSMSIGRKLGVAHLLGGSVRRAGGQVRIIVELIHVVDGSTLWSQRYERPYQDLFALQDEIAGTVAAALQTRLSTGAAGAVMQRDRPPSGNLDAYNAYLHGRFYDARRSEADYRKAIDYFTAATHLDPQYAAAHAGLVMAWSNLASYYLGGADARQAYANAKLASATALRLDPDLARAHNARGWLLQNADMDWIAAEAEFRRALQLAPNNSEAQSSLGWLLAALGQLSQAIDLTRQSIETDPLHADGYTALAAYLSVLGRLDDAEQAIGKAIELQPEAGWERVQLAIIKIQRGDVQAAQAALQQVHDEGGWLEIARAFVLQMGDDPVAADAALQTLIDTQADVSAFQIAQIYALRNQPDRVFQWLNRALANRDPGLSRLWFDPFILHYTDDPRFVAFCRKARLPVSGDAMSVALVPGNPWLAKPSVMTDDSTL